MRHILFAGHKAEWASSEGLSIPPLEAPRASLWSHSNTPVGRNPEREHPDKAGDRVEGLNFRVCWGKEGSKR
jgi:hypothetical protein